MDDMSGTKLSRRRAIMRCLAAVLLLTGSALALSGCVVAPAGPGYYGRHYGYGYRPPPPPHYYRPRPYW